MRCGKLVPDNQKRATDNRFPGYFRRKQPLYIMRTVFALLFSGLWLGTFAADLIVEEFGTAPAYPSITAALAAAEDGDRIIIKNRTGDIPWIENITVNKSLEFLNYADNGFFVVQGDWTITPADGRKVVIKGMRNTSGSILSGTGGTIGSSMLKVLDGQFVNGSIVLNTDAFRADIVGNELLAGRIRIHLGNVVGNKITFAGSAEALRVTPTTTTFQGDTCAVIANMVDNQNNTSTWEGIYVKGEAQVYHIRNNWVRHGWMGIEVQGGNTQGIANLIHNNSIQSRSGGTSTRYGISIANTTANSIWEIMNNAVGTLYFGSNRGINKDSGNNGQINVYYNHVASGMNPSISEFTYVANNTTDQPLTFNADGTFEDAPGAVDGGNPAAPFQDLDLTTGDAGAYGGSYTLDNFFPLHTGAARVYMTGHPFNLRTGATLRVRAHAWDR